MCLLARATFLLTLIWAAASASGAQQVTTTPFKRDYPDYGRVCLNRLGQMGWLNVVPVRAEIGEDDSVLQMVGERAACVYLPSSESYSITLHWRWDERNADSKEYSQPGPRIEVRPNATLSLDICPTVAPHSKGDVPWWKVTASGRCNYRP